MRWVKKSSTGIFEVKNTDHISKTKLLFGLIKLWLIKSQMANQDEELSKSRRTSFSSYLKTDH